MLVEKMGGRYFADGATRLHERVFRKTGCPRTTGPIARAGDERYFYERRLIRVGTAPHGPTSWAAGEAPVARPRRGSSGLEAEEGCDQNARVDNRTSRGPLVARLPLASWAARRERT